MRDAGVVCPGVDVLPRGRSAYRLFFDWSAMRMRLSGQVVGAALERRRKTIGLRGHDSLGGGPSGDLDLFVPRYSVVAWSVSLMSGTLGLLCAGMLTLIAYARPDDFGFRGSIMIAVTFALLVAMGVIVRSRRSGLRATAAGLEWIRVIGVRHFSWAEVQGVRRTDRGLRILITRGPRPFVGGRAGQRDLMVDAVLECAPRLWALGWGVGLSRVREPLADAELPQRVFEDEDGIVVEGPKRNRLVFRQEHPGYEEIKDAVQVRLLPRMSRERRGSSSPKADRAEVRT